jgi:hypothetical protein
VDEVEYEIFFGIIFAKQIETECPSKLRLQVEHIMDQNYPQRPKPANLA